MQKMKPLPIGVDLFDKLITSGYRYIDKSLLIKDLLDKKTDVNLFTRPRRFGKTLNMSMLQYFFEDMRDRKGQKQDNSGLFQGLKIMDAGENYLSHMGQYPVISLTLKSAKQPTFDLAYLMLKRQIADEFLRHTFVLEGEALTPSQKEKYLRIRDEKGDFGDYVDSLKFFSECLQLYYGKKTILLIDEYDVPLENAYERGFYQEMADFIRSLFESALKTNPNLEFAVITGCLRISKESIFTGLNNLDINSIMSVNYGEYFGFTEEEVREVCADYSLEQKFGELKNWYNGYYFGKTNVYNPWSTIKYIRDHVDDVEAFPVSYWANTSSNGIVRTLIERADRGVKDEIEALIAGGSIEKPVHEDITYDEIDKGMNNLWNFMFFTGYFKKVGERFENRICYVTLQIPNQEVLYIFEIKIRGWFDETLRKRDPQKLFDAIRAKDTAVIGEEISKMLMLSISFHDYYENFYHGFLAGVLYGMGDYVVKSNRETGRGRTDLWMKPVSRRQPVYLFEFKIAQTGRHLEERAKEALSQITEKRYDQEFIDDGYEEVVKFGVAFYEKDCVVVGQ